MPELTLAAQINFCLLLIAYCILPFASSGIFFRLASTAAAIFAPLFQKIIFMRFPLFIPLILCDLFCVMMLISSFNVGPAWKFFLSLAGVIIFSITAILAGGAILRQNEVRQNEGHH